MALPLVAGIVVTAIFGRILPWILALSAGLLVAFHDGFRELFYSVLFELVTLFFGFIELVFPKGASTLADIIDSIPPDAAVFLGYMRLPECFIILANGLAARLLRKLFLRF